MKSRTTFFHSLIKKFIAFIGILIIFVVIFEIVVRVTHINIPLAEEWMIDDEYYHVPYKDILFIMPSVEAIINPVNKKNSSNLITTLGDSFTEGYPLKQEYSYPSVLGNILNQQGQQIEIQNAGVGAYGPDQEYKLFTNYILPNWQPKLVIWQFYSNDIWDNINKALYTISDNKLIPLSADTHWFNVRREIYALLPLRKQLVQNSELVRAMFFIAEKIWMITTVPLGKKNAIQWSINKIKLEISQMNNLAQKYNFKIIYVLITPQAFYNNPKATASNQYPILEYYQLRNILEKEQYFVDIDTYKNILGITSDPIQKMYVGDDVDGEVLGDRHFNKEGYEMVASLISSKSAELLAK